MRSEVALAAQCAGRQHLRRWLLWSLCLLVVGACSGPDSAVRPEPGASDVALVVDGPRVIAVAPSAVEQLFALGLGDQLVGVGDYAAWPASVEGLPKLGGLYDFRLERIVELKPDVAVLLTSEEALRGRLEELGVEVLVVPSETLGDVDIAMRSIVDRFDLGEKGNEAIARWWLMLEPRLAGDRGVEVMLTVGREPGSLGSLLVAGQKTFLNDLLQRLGAVNTFADSAVRYPQVGLDLVLDRSPRIILELRSVPLTEEGRSQAAGDWASIGSEWAEGVCVVSIEGSHTLLAGPRLPQLFNEMAAALEGCRQG